MAGTDSQIPSILNLGSVALETDEEIREVPVDFFFSLEVKSHLDGVLDHLDKAGGIPRLLFVTGSESVRDAALIAVAIANRAAGRGMEVLLVDASLAAPVLPKPFPYQPEEGLVDMVLWGASIQATLRKSREERIRVINTGSPAPAPERFWEEADCDAVLHTLRNEVALVIVVGPLFDGGDKPSGMLQKADRTILVREKSQKRVDLTGYVAEGRLAEVLLDGDAETPRPKVVEAEEIETEGDEMIGEGTGRAGTRISLWRTVFIFSGVCIVIGILLSWVYLNRWSGDREGETRVASGTQEARGVAARDEDAATVPEDREAPGAVESERSDRERTTPARNGDAPDENAGEIPVPAIPADERPVEKPVEEPAVETAVVPPVLERAAPAEKPVVEVPAVTGPFYGIHVESFSSFEDALRGSTRFREKGVEVTIIEKTIEGKGAWHRLILGKFADSGEARAYSEEVKKQFQLSYVLVVRVDE